MTWAQTYALRFRAFDVSRTAATYGGGTYGAGTYGTEVTDPLANKDYVMMPRGGSWPSEAGWSFRVGDIGIRFEAELIGVDGSLVLAPLTSAVLVLERISGGPRLIDAWPLTIDVAGNYVWRAWVLNDLPAPGVYRVQVIVGYTSNRWMTIEPTDAATLIVRAGGSDALV